MQTSEKIETAQMGEERRVEIVIERYLHLSI